MINKMLKTLKLLIWKFVFSLFGRIYSEEDGKVFINHGIIDGLGLDPGESFERGNYRFSSDALGNIIQEYEE